MKTAKIGAIFLVSVMALAGASAGYALWLDELHLDIDVYTGNIGLEWSIEGFGDSEPYEKDFSYIDGYLWGWTEDANTGLWLTIYNGYPCIDYYVDFNIECTGSIPVHIEDPYLWGFNQLTGPNGLGTLTFTYADGSPITFPIQIHPGQIIYGRITIHFNNNLPQDSFEWVTCISFPYHQWNEPMP